MHAPHPAAHSPDTGAVCALAAIIPSAGETAWRIYRHETCKANEDSYDGGTAGPLAKTDCESSLTREHMKELGDIHLPSREVTGNRRDKVAGIGAEYVHIAIDDHSRVAIAAIYPDEKRASVLHFLHAALAFYKRFGIDFQRLLTDNGVCYRSHAFRDTCRELGIKHKRTRPYRPQTNGKAERVIKTALNEWAYARTYQKSTEREQHLMPRIHPDNWHRPHSSLALLTPITTTGLSTTTC